MEKQKTLIYTDTDDIAHLVPGEDGKAWICGFSSMPWEDEDADEDTTPPPYLTINLSDKWYGPALVERDGEEPRVVSTSARLHYVSYYDYDGGSPCLDHAINPAALVWAARKNGAVVPDLALELLIGRWVMEYHGFDDEDLTTFDNVIIAGKRASQVSAALQSEQKKVRDLERVNDALRAEIRAQKEEISALKQEVMEAKRR